MVGSKLSKRATKVDHRICRAYQRHGSGDDDDCKTKCFYEKVASRLVLKILTADIPKTRPPSSDASSPIPVKRHRAIIAVNQREPVPLANNFWDRLHVSFQFLWQHLVQCLCQLEMGAGNAHWERDLALLKEFTAVSRQTRLWDDVVPSLGRSREND
jgi:hypothetical protein